MKILADASLPGLKAAFPEPFIITTYHSELELSPLLDKHDILLCRSTLKVTNELLDGTSLKYVATASSGTDHLDHSYLASQKVQIIDAKGCNAISVADYIESCLAYLTEQHLILGKKIGIIGMGKVGSQVFSRLNALGFNLITYDPLKAMRELKFEGCQIEELYHCDIICIHAELHRTYPFPSFDLINKEFLSNLKPGCIMINAARGGIVNEEALLNTSQSLIYCTDVYLGEPKPNPQIIDRATLCTPHIAGHSLEAKYEAVAMVSRTLHRLVNLPTPVFAAPEFKNPIIRNSVLPWHETILSLYNPYHETQFLKQAKDKEHAFLYLRKNHNVRHDFYVVTPHCQ